MMKNPENPQKIVEWMLKNDRFSNWLGIKLLSVEIGKVTLELEITDVMLNGFDILHGGIAFALADSALAFASNTHGRRAVSLEALINYTAPVFAGDTLTAIAEESNLTNNTAVYDITIFNQHKRKVALFRGTVYRTNKDYSDVL
ncbi:MAG: hotdog fold thioesterase [Candidatus Kapabacteria bacterium]|nr:hotdog fold thioesterase [Candidatus Kapabacteria bacterium]